MSPLLAALLMLLSHQMLSTITEVALPGYYEPSMVGVTVDTRVVSDIIGEVNPQLLARMDAVRAACVPCTRCSTVHVHVYVKGGRVWTVGLTLLGCRGVRLGFLSRWWLPSGY